MRLTAHAPQAALVLAAITVKQNPSTARLCADAHAPYGASANNRNEQASQSPQQRLEEFCHATGPIANEMVSSSTVAAIRAEDGNEAYEYYVPLDDPESDSQFVRR